MMKILILMNISENIGGHFDTKYHLIHTYIHTHTHTHTYTHTHTHIYIYIYISRMKDENIGSYGYIRKYLWIF